MDNEIIITSDSTCDLSPALVQENDIRILPLRVILGADSFYDGIDVTPQDIFDFVDRTGELPKTAAPSIGEYREFSSSSPTRERRSSISIFPRAQAPRTNLPLLRQRSSAQMST